MIHLALDPRVADLPISPTLAARARSAELGDSGKRVFRLGLGQSPFPVPSPVVGALRSAAQERDYLPPGGLWELRSEIAEFHRRRHGLTFAAGDIVVGPGSKELMFLLQLCFDGDILIPTPSWVSYKPQACLAGRNLVAVPGGGRHGLMVDPRDLAALTTGAKPRLLFLNSPCNPTGLVYTESELTAIADVCRQRGIVILADDIYADLGFSERLTSIAQLYPEGTIVASGLSKWCGAGGWRLGTFAFPESLRPLRRALEAVASETYSSTSAPIQYAALVAFRQSVEIETYLAGARRVLAGILQWAAVELTAAGLDVPAPAGGFYMFPSFNPVRDALARRDINTDLALSRRVLDDTGVVCLPGSSFGLDPGALRLRLALVDFDGATALEAALRAPQIDRDFLQRYVRPVYDGIEGLAAWTRALRT